MISGQRLAHQPQASRAQRGEACRLEAQVGQALGWFSHLLDLIHNLV
jgi:hypothetical protein